MAPHWNHGHQPTDVGGQKTDRHISLLACARIGTTAMTQSIRTSLAIKSLTARPTPLTCCDFMSLTMGITAHSSLLYTVQIYMHVHTCPPPHPHQTCGRLHHSSQSLVTHQNDTAKARVIRPLKWALNKTLSAYSLWSGFHIQTCI
jgi:hypothetical protein